MSFKKLQWLFPIAVTLHNGEEAVWMPGWALQHAGQLPMHPPGALLVRVVLIALVIAAFAVTYLSEREGPRSVWAYLLFGGIVAMLVNVFVPHVPATLLFRSLHAWSGDCGFGESSRHELFGFAGGSGAVGFWREGCGVWSWSSGGAWRSYLSADGLWAPLASEKPFTTGGTEGHRGNHSLAGRSFVENNGAVLKILGSLERLKFAWVLRFAQDDRE